MDHRFQIGQLARPRESFLRMLGSTRSCASFRVDRMASRSTASKPQADRFSALCVKPTFCQPEAPQGWRTEQALPLNRRRSIDPYQNGRKLLM